MATFLLRASKAWVGHLAGLAIVVKASRGKRQGALGKKCLVIVGSILEIQKLNLALATATRVEARSAGLWSIVSACIAHGQGIVV